MQAPGGGPEQKVWTLPDQSKSSQISKPGLGIASYLAQNVAHSPLVGKRDNNLRTRSTPFWGVHLLVDVTLEPKESQAGMFQHRLIGASVGKGEPSVVMFPLAGAGFPLDLVQVRRPRAVKSSTLNFEVVVCLEEV